MKRRERAERRPLAEAEAVWMYRSRMIAFFFGLALLSFETLSGGNRFHVWIAGIALCGTVVSQGAAAMFAAIRGGAAGE